MKADAPDLIKKEVKKAHRDVVALSGVTDPYQPAEKRYKITRKILEILRDNEFPVHIGTKSDLVLKDIDLLSEISENSWCTVSFTITTFNRKLFSTLEPFAPASEKRLEAMKKLKEVGVQAGVNFTPIIPYILDNDENIREVIEKTSAAGARYILPGSGMTLRSNQRVRFLGLLRENWPNLVPKYKKLYGNLENPPSWYVTAINKKTFQLCKEFRIPDYIEPPVFKRPLQKNFEVANLLLLVAYFKEKRTGNPYGAWAYHKAAQNIGKLQEDIRIYHKNDNLKAISGVGKSLASVITEFLDTGECEKLERLKSEW